MPIPNNFASVLEPFDTLMYSVIKAYDDIDHVIDGLGQIEGVDYTDQIERLESTQNDIIQTLRCWGMVKCLRASSSPIIHRNTFRDLDHYRNGVPTYTELENPHNGAIHRFYHAPLPEENEVA